MPTNWNKSMYYDFWRWSIPAPRNAAGCPTDERDEAFDAVRHERREAHVTAGPVVAHYVRRSTPTASMMPTTSPTRVGSA